MKTYVVTVALNQLIMFAWDGTELPSIGQVRREVIDHMARGGKKVSVGDFECPWYCVVEVDTMAHLKIVYEDAATNVDLDLTAESYHGVTVALSMLAHNKSLSARGVPEQAL